MTRIRYQKGSDETANFLTSKEEILLPSGKLINIVLYEKNNSYIFVDVNDQSVVSEGSSNSLINLKKLVRATLLELGVPLEVEVKKFKPKTQAA